MAKPNQPSSDKPATESSQPAAIPKAEPLVLFERPQISDKQKAALATLGFDIDPFFNAFDKFNAFYASEMQFRAEVEKGFNAVGVALNKIAPLAELVEKAQQQRQNQPSTQEGQRGGGIGLDQVLQLVLGGGGGGGLSESDKWLIDIGRETIGLSSEIFKAVVKEAVPTAMDAWNKKKAEMQPKPVGAT